MLVLAVGDRPVREAQEVEQILLILARAEATRVFTRFVKREFYHPEDAPVQTADRGREDENPPTPRGGGGGTERETGERGTDERETRGEQQQREVNRWLGRGNDGRRGGCGA